MGFLRQDIDFEQGELFLKKPMKLYRIKIVEKAGRNQSLLVTRTDYESDEYSQIIEDLSDYTHRFEF
jgi:ATP-binding cassette subfamily F protein 3